MTQISEIPENIVPPFEFDTSIDISQPGIFPVVVLVTPTPVDLDDDDIRDNDLCITASSGATISDHFGDCGGMEGSGYLTISEDTYGSQYYGWGGMELSELVERFVSPTRKQTELIEAFERVASEAWDHEELTDMGGGLHPNFKLSDGTQIDYDPRAALKRLLETGVSSPVGPEIAELELADFDGLTYAEAEAKLKELAPLEKIEFEEAISKISPEQFAAYDQAALKHSEQEKGIEQRSEAIAKPLLDELVQSGQFIEVQLMTEDRGDYEPIARSVWHVGDLLRELPQFEAAGFDPVSLRRLRLLAERPGLPAVESRMAQEFANVITSGFVGL